MAGRGTKGSSGKACRESFPKLNNGWNERLSDVLRLRYPAKNKRRINTAKIAFELGVVEKTVEHWLDGAREINFTILFKLWQMTGLCIHWIITGEGPAESPPPPRKRHD